MPGIAGIISKKKPESVQPDLRRMIETLRHEPAYKSGTWSDESLGIYLGWTTVSGSFADGAPFTNEKGDVSLIFAGEEYPEPGTLESLKQGGHSFNSGDASYLVHLYEENPGFLANLNGIFHGLLVDKTQGIAVLFNDRYGMHRICYHETKDAFYFAAEAKAILAVLPELRRVDNRGLGELISFSCVLQDRTIFRDIQVLPGGSAWIFRNGSIERRTNYFNPRQWEEQEPLEPEPFYGQLRQAFSRNLPRYFGGRQQVGMTLTGGLDTRVILALHKLAPESISCYTFGGMIRDSEDVRLGRRVAQVCQQAHEVLTVGKDFLSRFPHYAARSVYFTEGGVDVLSRFRSLYQ